MAVDVQIGVGGRVAEHRFGFLHAGSGRAIDGHVFVEQGLVESAVGEGLEIDRLARFIIDESPGRGAVAEGHAVGVGDNVEAVGEVTINAIHPRAELIALAREREVVEFQHEAREHPSAVMRLHVGEPEIMRFGVERRDAQNEVAERAPSQVTGVVFLERLDYKGVKEFFFGHGGEFASGEGEGLFSSPV